MRKILYLLLCMVSVIGCPFHANAQIITTVAGSGMDGYTGDGGAAVSATFNAPSCVAVDGTGNLYVNDQGNNCVRKITPSGIITTVAGNGTAGYIGDGGPATLAELSANWGMTVDAAGNIYITDQHNNCVRKVNTSGIITTIAGNGTPGFSGDGGNATAAQLHTPIGIAVDGAGNVYIGDVSNWRIRMVNTSGIISTVAGTGVAGYSGDGGPALSAKLNSTFGLAVDAFGNLYICDGINNRVRKVSSSGIISTIAGTGVPGFNADGITAVTAYLYEPTGVFVAHSGDVYIADYFNNRIRQVNTSGIINTVAGTGAPGFFGDGDLAINAKLDNPVSVAMNGDNTVTYLTDFNNVRTRMISDANVVYFTGGTTQNITVCENSTANPINSLLAILDHEVGFTDTWGLLSGPSHGSAIAAYSATATGSTFTPSGLSYTPAGGYVGNDAFSVVINDGLASDTTTISVTVEPVLPPAGAISGASNVCVGASIILSETVPGGVWTVTNDSATIADSIVNGVLAGKDTVVYTVSNMCGSDSISKVISIIPLPDPGVITGANDMCEGTSVTLTDTTTGGIWSASNSLAIISPTATGCIVYGFSKGMDTLSYNVTNSLCEANDVFVVTIDTFPDAGIITGPAGVCIGAEITLSDTSGNGVWNSSNANAILSGDTLMGKAAGIDTVSYSVANICGTTTATQTFIIEPLPAQPVITQYESTVSIPGGYASYQWVLNGANIPGAVTDSYTVAVTGLYDVVVTNSFGCAIAAGPLTTYGCGPDDIKVFPNPAKSIVYIDWCKTVTVVVFCADGKKAETVKNTNYIDLEDFPNGNYVLSLFDVNGNRIKTEKVTKLRR